LVDPSPSYIISAQTVKPQQLTIPLTGLPDFSEVMAAAPNTGKKYPRIG